MLMTGADERGVVAIERMTKQKFAPYAVSAPRSERRDRRDDDRARRRDAPPSHRERKPVDDFFTRPYEPGAADASGGLPPQVPAEKHEQPKGRVAALLGGRRK